MNGSVVLVIWDPGLHRGTDDSEQAIGDVVQHQSLRLSLGHLTIKIGFEWSIVLFDRQRGQVEQLADSASSSTI